VATDTTVTASLGSVIRSRREKLGFSLRDLAARTGRDFGFLSRIETGQRSPRLDLLIDVARALRVKPSSLLRSAGL
jgi:transcriptional regulator with XRE-family HTH domain